MATRATRAQADDRSPESLQGLNHIRLTVAMLLALFLAILWLSGHGPWSAAGCCIAGGSVSESGKSGPAYTVSAPNAEVMAGASSLQPWTAPTYPAWEHEVQFPSAAAVAEVVATETEAVTPEEPTPAEPEYTITAPNAEVTQGASTLPPWAAPIYPVYEHEVQYPTAVMAAATDTVTPAPDEAAADTSPAIAEDQFLPDEPAYRIIAPNAEVMQSASTLPPWSGPVYPTHEHEVHIPPPVTMSVEPPAEAETPAPAEPLPDAPAYTITAPNAEVMPGASTLSAWTGPAWPRPEHFVYYYPAVPPVAAVVAETTIAADLPATVRIYFRTSRYALPADAGARLAPVVDYLGQHPGAKVEIRGFHDPRGEQASNRVLAGNRAASVRAALLAAGIDESRILLPELEDTTGSGSLAEARRAEVIVRSD